MTSGSSLRGGTSDQDSSAVPQVTSTLTPPGPCSLPSRTTWCAGSARSDWISRVHSSPRRSGASSSRCPVGSPTLGDDATFTCQHNGPGLPRGGTASSGSSNYRPSHFGFEVARGTPGDFQRE